MLQQAVGQINSARVEMSATLTINATAPSALTAFDAHPMDATLQVTLNGFSNISATLQGKVGSGSVDTNVIEVDGVVYVSQDNGKTWTKSDALPASLNAIELPLEYLFSVDKVTDQGSRTVKGQKLEMYQATLKGATLGMTVGTAIANVEPAYANFAHAAQSATFAGGQLTVATDGAGHVVQENGYVDISMPSSAIQSGATGNVTLRTAIMATFSKYGAAAAPATAPPAP